MSDNIYYPFGYGLSYGKVDYTNLRVATDKKNRATIQVTLVNHSSWSITETPQVYVSAPGAGISAPIQQLVGFQRIALSPGESKEVQFDIPIEHLMTVQEDGISKLIRGEYVFTVSSAAPSMRNKDLGISTLNLHTLIK